MHLIPVFSNVVVQGIIFKAIKKTSLNIYDRKYSEILNFVFFFIISFKISRLNVSQIFLYLYFSCVLEAIVLISFT